MAKFYRRPPPVEAIQFDGTLEGMDKVIQWAKENTPYPEYFRKRKIRGEIKLVIGNYDFVKENDWVVFEEGEFFSLIEHYSHYSPQIFEILYAPL